MEKVLNCISCIVSGALEMGSTRFTEYQVKDLCC